MKPPNTFLRYNKRDRRELLEIRGLNILSIYIFLQKNSLL